MEPRVPQLGPNPATKNLFSKVKVENRTAVSDKHKGCWPNSLNPEMVGYFNEATMPAASVQAPEEPPYLTIKRVVCSPDLPIPGFSNPAEQENVQCQVCNKTFTSKMALQTHQRTHTKESDDPYRCNMCSKTFAVPARLTRHYRTHTGEKPFKCEFCNKSFSVKENLSVHRRIHTKERPYKCDVCSRAFEHSGKLHRHMRIHTGERPHKCTICSKTFIQSGQLVIHMRTHTGEKPYVCTVCQKGFTCSKQLKVHSRTHTGEKPYSCEICGKSFGYNHVLKLHQVAHYGEKVYKCTICNETFNSKKCMEAHIKSHSESVPVASPTSSIPSESSCSSISDKENKDIPLELVSSPREQSAIFEHDVPYYIYSKDRERLSPAVLPPYVPRSVIYPSGVQMLAEVATGHILNEQLRRVDSEEVLDFSAEALAVLRHPAYFTKSIQIDRPLDAANQIRDQVEGFLKAAGSTSEEEPSTSPSSSGAVSPAPSLSSDTDRELSLPPRKRSRMILKSMETINPSPVRHNSVIQYAGAS